MIGLLKSAEQYVEVKKFLKELYAYREHIAKNPDTYAAFFNGKTPDANSVKDVLQVMSQVNGKNNSGKQQDLYTKYMANLAACNAITNNKEKGNKLPTLKEVDNSYYCFRQEITDAASKGPSSFVFADSTYASTVDAEKQKVLDQQNVFLNKQTEKSQARGKLWGHRLLRLLLGIPILAIMAASGFAFYAGLSWLAVQTITLSPLALVAAILPGYLGYRLGRFLFRKPFKSLGKKIDEDKADYKAKKVAYKQEKQKFKEMQNSFDGLRRECNKNLKVKYPYEPDFDAKEAQKTFAQRMNEIKEPGQTDEKQEIPEYSFQTEIEQKKAPEREISGLDEDIKNTQETNLENDDALERIGNAAPIVDQLFANDSETSRTGKDEANKETDKQPISEGVKNSRTAQATASEEEVAAEEENAPEKATEPEAEETAEETSEEPTKETNIVAVGVENNEAVTKAEKTNEEENAGDKEEPKEVSEETSEEDDELEETNDDEPEENNEEPYDEESMLAERNEYVDAYGNPGYNYGYANYPANPNAGTALVPFDYWNTMNYSGQQPENGQNSKMADVKKKLLEPIDNPEEYIKFIEDKKATRQTGVVSGNYEAKPHTTISEAVLAVLTTLEDREQEETTLDFGGVKLKVKNSDSVDKLVAEYNRLSREEDAKEQDVKEESVKAPQVETKETTAETKPVAVHSATAKNKANQQEKRRKNREAFMVSGRNVSKEEAIEIMNSTMEADYAGNFDEINAIDFAEIKNDVYKEYDGVKEAKPGYISDEEDYLEQLYRATYNKAVCDYYGRFVPREYARNENVKVRIQSPMDAKIAHTKDISQLSYEELDDKKSELTFKKKAYEALYQLGEFNESSEEELDAVKDKIEDIKAQLNAAEEDLVRRRAIIKEIVTAQIEGLVNEGKSVKIKADDFKLSVASVKETIKTTTDALAKEKKNAPKAPKKKASEEEKQAYKETMAKYSAKCEAMQAEIDRNEQLRTLFEAYDFYKSYSYQNKTVMQEQLEAASLSAGALVYLEAMFKGADGQNTQKFKIVNQYRQAAAEAELSSMVEADRKAAEASLLADGKNKTKIKLSKVVLEDNKPIVSKTPTQSEELAEEEVEQKPEEPPQEPEKTIEEIIAETNEEEPVKVRTSGKNKNVRNIGGDLSKKRKTAKQKTAVAEETIKKADDATADAEELLKQLENAKASKPAPEPTYVEEEPQSTNKAQVLKTAKPESKTKTQQTKPSPKAELKQIDKQPEPKAEIKGEQIESKTAKEPLRRTKKASAEVRNNLAKKGKKQDKQPTKITALDIYRAPIDLNRKEPPNNPRNIPVLDNADEENEESGGIEK